ncbi:Transmembrane protein [Ceratobasidium theobromae]|uniref:Transmembrane protein n=1 Tax=Ceratobasidium theobromae TaxID=1582974 RepID=A0A5N5QB20_9AGAM|nr:Transmembrane protein [Ceratobasidium theobromae]
MPDENDVPPPDYNPDEVEERIRVALRDLQDLFDLRTAARARGDQERVRNLDQQIPIAMRRIGDAYPDAERRLLWYRKAEEYDSAGMAEKETIAMSILKGLGLLIAAPLALAGGVVAGTLFTAGAILYGVGKVVGGLGSALTAGFFK